MYRRIFLRKGQEIKRKIDWGFDFLLIANHVPPWSAPLSRHRRTAPAAAPQRGAPHHHLPPALLTRWILATTDISRSRFCSRPVQSLQVQVQGWFRGRSPAARTASTRSCVLELAYHAQRGVRSWAGRPCPRIARRAGWPCPRIARE
jgi:hypothetical protein